MVDKNKRNEKSPTTTSYFVQFLATVITGLRASGRNNQNKIILMDIRQEAINATDLAQKLQNETPKDQGEIANLVFELLVEFAYCFQQDFGPQGNIRDKREIFDFLHQLWRWALGRDSQPAATSTIDRPLDYFEKLSEPIKQREYSVWTREKILDLLKSLKAAAQDEPSSTSFLPLPFSDKYDVEYRNRDTARDAVTRKTMSEDDVRLLCQGLSKPILLCQIVPQPKDKDLKPTIEFVYFGPPFVSEIKADTFDNRTPAKYWLSEIIVGILSGKSSNEIRYYSKPTELLYVRRYVQQLLKSLGSPGNPDVTLGIGIKRRDDQDAPRVPIYFENTHPISVVLVRNLNS